MGIYIARRLMLMVVAAVGVTLISFVISHAVPSDPVVANLGQQASQRPEIVAAYKALWGLDKPLHLIQGNAHTLAVSLPHSLVTAHKGRERDASSAR